MTVESFDSFEEAQAHIESRVRASVEAIQDFQRPMMDGKRHYFLRLVAYGPGDVLLIAGWTYDLEQHSKELAEKFSEEVTYEEQLAEFRSGVERGYVLTKAYSAWEPTGETGDTFFCTMLEISERQFGLFQDLGFDLQQSVREPELNGLIEKWIIDVHHQ